MFALTALYIVHLLKVHYHYVSLGKLSLYKSNEWIVPKFKANFYILHVRYFKCLQGFQVKIQDFQQFIDPCMLY